MLKATCTNKLELIVTVVLLFVTHLTELGSVELVIVVTHLLGSDSKLLLVSSVLGDETLDLGLEILELGEDILELVDVGGDLDCGQVGVSVLLEEVKEVVAGSAFIVESLRVEAVLLITSLLEVHGGESGDGLGHVVGNGVHLGDLDTLHILEDGGELFPHGGKGLAVSTPGSVELNEDSIIRLVDLLDKVLGDELANNSLLLLGGDGLGLDVTLNLSVEVVLEELLEILSGKAFLGVPHVLLILVLDNNLGEGVGVGSHVLGVVSVVRTREVDDRQLSVELGGSLAGEGKGSVLLGLDFGGVLLDLLLSSFHAVAGSSVSGVEEPDEGKSAAFVGLVVLGRDLGEMREDSSLEELGDEIGVETLLSVKVKVHSRGLVFEETEGADDRGGLHIELDTSVGVHDLTAAVGIESSRRAEGSTGFTESLLGGLVFLGEMSEDVRGSLALEELVNLSLAINGENVREKVVLNGILDAIGTTVTGVLIDNLSVLEDLDGGETSNRELLGEITVLSGIDGSENGIEAGLLDALGSFFVNWLQALAVTTPGSVELDKNNLGRLDSRVEIITSDGLDSRVGAVVGNLVFLGMGEPDQEEGHNENVEHLHDVCMELSANRTRSDGWGEA